MKKVTFPRLSGWLVASAALFVSDRLDLFRTDPGRHL